MASKYRQSIFKPKNPEKYIGKGTIQMRSSWETHFAIFLDTNPAILEWASEPIRIPYIHPITQKHTTYVPDFLIRYKDKHNQIINELIEIKPYKQSVIEGKMNEKQRITVAINHAKWAEAQKWCDKNNIAFRIITENQLYKK